MDEVMVGERGSEVMSKRWRPSSQIKDLISGEKARPPKTRSIYCHRNKVVTGFQVSILSHFASFFSASSATLPASLVVRVVWEGAKVSGWVASHTRAFPPFQGASWIEAPSGHLPSE